MVFDSKVFNEMPIVGIMRNLGYSDVMNILPMYATAGLRTVEITMNSPDATRIIHSAVKGYPGLNIGAGTVISVADLDQALNAGAQFIVSPNLDEKIIKLCNARDIPIFPGAFTPTEILKAWELGAYMVKVFPAGALGFSYMKNILAPLNSIKLLATGGIDLEEMKNYLSIGVKGFGIGSTLFPTQMIQDQDWEALKIHFKKFVQEINEYHSKKSGNQES